MKLFYRKLGSGQPAIILHGLFGMSDNWLTIAKRIAEKHTVFIPDQRNHGHSPQSDAFSYDLLAEDLSGFVSEHHLDRLRLIGHSMGGKVAMTFALRNPDIVEKLVVVDIAPRAYKPTHFEQFFNIMLRIDLGQMKTRLEVEQALATEIGNPAIRQFLLKNLMRDNQNRFEWKINLSGIYKNLDNMFGKITDQETYEGDTLFISGGKSAYIKSSDHRNIRKLFPLAEIVTIPQAGHWIHADAPEEFCNHLRRFFSA